VMSFGWTPNNSCFAPTVSPDGTPAQATSIVPTTAAAVMAAAPTQVTTTQQVVAQNIQATGSPAGVCEPPTWFLSFLGLAIIAGFASRKR